jgi:hypothetical protein
MATILASNLELLTNWIQPGAVGNSYGSTATGTFLFTAGNPATWSAQGNAPYADGYYYRTLGTTFNALTHFQYDLQVSFPTAGDLNACQAIEFELQQNVGGMVHNMAIQADFLGTGKWTYFHFTNNASAAWIPTNITVDKNLFALGTYVSISAQFIVDHVAHTTTHVSLTINGTVYPIGVTQAATALVDHDYVNAAFQIDCNGLATPTPFVVKTRNMNVTMSDGVAVIIQPNPVVNVNSQPVTVITLPASPGFRAVEFSFEDAGAENKSPFTGWTQVLQWPGSDMLSGTMTLPPMTQDQADAWKAALMSCRGKANGFMLGDPAKNKLGGNTQGSIPLVDGSVAGSNVAGTTILSTKNWKPSSFRLLLPGDYLQIGVRLHVVMYAVNSDASGKASIEIYPSIRETPADGLAVNLNKPKGLFRRKNNVQTWSAMFNRLTALSFQIEEYR